MVKHDLKHDRWRNERLQHCWLVTMCRLWKYIIHGAPTWCKVPLATASRNDCSDCSLACSLAFFLQFAPLLLSCVGEALAMHRVRFQCKQHNIAYLDSSGPKRCSKCNTSIWMVGMHFHDFLFSQAAAAHMQSHRFTCDMKHLTWITWKILSLSDTDTVMHGSSPFCFWLSVLF